MTLQSQLSHLLKMEKLKIAFAKSLPPLEKINEISRVFTKQYFQKPMILVLDEFDSLQEAFINRFAGIFRDMFTTRTNERNKSTQEKSCLLHGLALIGVRSVLGIENERGSPFNIQRSLHIPNLALDEVEIFACPLFYFLISTSAPVPGMNTIFILCPMF